MFKTTLSPISKLDIFALIVALLILSFTACGPTPTPSPSPSFSQYELAYQLIDKYPDLFWCDPDF